MNLLLRMISTSIFLGILITPFSYAHNEEEMDAFTESENVLAENPLMAVTFEISAGTGDGAWNTAEKPIEVCGVSGKATITYKNLDSVVHRVHTNGTPHVHMPKDVAPGESIVQTINAATFDNTGANSANNMYDHNYGPKTSRIYFRLVKCD